jgi:hypothetical protein
VARSAFRPGLALLFAAAVALALSPVALVRVPAMVDYPNHLARMFLIGRDGTAAAHPAYDVAWAMYPNLAMDLIVPRLARLIGTEAATRAFLSGCQVLLVSGALALEWVVKRRPQLAGPAALIFLYSVPFAWGFLNFQFGLGVAVWGVAAWWALRERSGWGRLGAHSLFVLVLFAAHLFALGIYGTAVGLLEIWRARDRAAPLRATLVRLAGVAAPAAALIAALPLAGGAVGGTGTDWDAGLKVAWPAILANGYDATLACGSALALAALAAALVTRGVIRLHPAGKWLGAGLLALYVAVPWRLFDTAFVDIRVLAAAAYLVPAFVWYAAPSAVWERATVAVLGAVLAANLSYVHVLWRALDRDYQALIASFGLLRPGARVLIGHSGAGRDPPIADLAEYPLYSAPVLAVHFADAFVPTLFTAPGKQPLTVRHPHRHLSVPYGGPVPLALLAAAERGSIRAELPAYARAWRDDFDYLYVVGRPAPNPVPDALTVMQNGARFVLYRVNQRHYPR